MPHIIVTAPNHYTPPIAWRDILTSLNHVMAGIDPSFKLSDCKSRVILSNDAVVGDGSPSTDHIVIAIEIRIMPGRSNDIVQQVTPAIYHHLSTILGGGPSPIELTVDIQDLSGPRYSKGII